MRREHRSIDDTKALDPMHFQLRVHYACLRRLTYPRGRHLRAAATSVKLGEAEMRTHRMERSGSSFTHDVFDIVVCNFVRVRARQPKFVGLVI